MNEDELVSYHAREILPLYRVEYEVVVGKTMKDCIQHGQTIFPGAVLKKASEYDQYTCKMTHPELKTRYMILLEIGPKGVDLGLIAKAATELSLYMMDELEITCNKNNFKSQATIVMSIFNRTLMATDAFLEKIDPDEKNFNEDIGDL